MRLDALPAHRGPRGRESLAPLYSATSRHNIGDDRLIALGLDRVSMAPSIVLT